jgi:dolichol-phosphate mannosyltransferase
MRMKTLIGRLNVCDAVLSIIVPTYNEKENIRTIIEAILSLFDRVQIEGEVIIVDDDSPDGTGSIATSIKESEPRLQVIVRRGVRGLSSATLSGFEIAKGDILLVMDSDLSHPVELIPALVSPIVNGLCEMSVASRHVSGGGIKDWSLKRKIISKGATLLARIVTDVKDPMSGFFAIKPSVIKGIKLNPKGFKICLEIIARGNYGKIAEIPYTFQDRKFGVSKLRGQIIWEYILQLSSLLYAKNSTFRQFTKFCLVGLAGVAVNLAVFYSLMNVFGIWYILGAGFAFVAAVTWNYILNRIWTFKNEFKPTSQIFNSYLRFIIVSLVGLTANLALLYVFVEDLHINYILSQVLAISVVSVWNYYGSRIWVFRQNSLIDQVRYRKS